MNTLSIQRPLQSMRMAITRRVSSPVHSRLALEGPPFQKHCLFQPFRGSGTDADSEFAEDSGKIGAAEIISRGVLKPALQLSGPRRQGD
jgi:hypothetical protein